MVLMDGFTIFCLVISLAVLILTLSILLKMNMTKGFMMEEKMNVDTNSGLTIRLTDNTPKEEDDFQKLDQYARPMSEEEIKAKIDEMAK